MADRRLVTLAAAVLSVVLAGCTGVPEAGAVHRTQAAQDVKGVADYPQQQAQGPQPKAGQSTIIEGLLAAMSAGDSSDAQQFMTSDFGNHWVASQQALIFAHYDLTAVPRTDNTQWKLTFQQTASIDSSSSYRRNVGSVSVTFTLQQSAAGEWRVSGISQPGTFIFEQSLATTLSPRTLYFPSRVAGPSGVPRLVPDTVFLPRGSTDLPGLVQQLLQGPTHWLAPAVTMPTPPTVQVISAAPDSSGDINISLQHVGELTPQAIRTLQAQIAYTLTAAQPALIPVQFQLLSNNQPLGGPFLLSQVADGYNPDVLTSGSPYYFVRQDELLMQTPSTQVAPNIAAGTTLLPEEPLVVMAHVGANIGQIAVSEVADAAGTDTRAVAGVLTASGQATLEVGAIPESSADPWTAVGLPQSKALSTPSFDAVGRSVWTVATAASGATQVYRIPYGIGLPVGTPQPVEVTGATGRPLLGVSEVRLSRDGARAVVVAKGAKGPEAYVGVVAETTSGGATVWTISGARPVTADADTVVDVSWANQSSVGVVVQTAKATGSQPAQTQLETVPADGYVAAADSGVSTSAPDQALVAGAPSGALHFSGGPGLLWLTSVDGRLRRQAAPSSTEAPDADVTWDDNLGEGTWPTYAG